jgi:putative ABC transport system ATP-binding protein
MATSSVREATAAPAASGPAPLIELRGVEKVYRTGRLEYPALRGIDLRIDRGEMVAVVGPSGSGKSTVLNMITGIDRPSAGSVAVGGARVDQMGEEALARWRGEHVGIVFQFFQLLPTLTALENAVLPLDLAHRHGRRERHEIGRRHLGRVGLGGMEDHLPSELSGGEQQRVAIARALACDPELLVGDEPTGNLDSTTAGQMFDLLSELHAGGTTILYVTHDEQLAARSPRTVTIRDGRVDGGALP